MGIAWMLGVLRWSRESSISSSMTPEARYRVLVTWKSSIIEHQLHESVAGGSHDFRAGSMNFGIVDIVSQLLQAW